MRIGDSGVAGVALSSSTVMPGLDPGIHPASQDSFKKDGLPGQARQ
jgi:hypothetical protein